MNGQRQRPSYFATVVESARQTVLTLLGDRMLWVLAASGVLLAGLGFLLSSRARDDFAAPRLFCVLAWWLHGTVLMPWTTLYLGITVVHGPIEDRTFQYTFLRPVDRSALLFGKWLGICAVAVPIAVSGVALLFAGLAARPSAWPDGLEWRLPFVFAAVVAGGAVVYAAIAALFAVWLRRPLVMAALFVVGLQTVTANLHVSAGLRRITVVDPLRRLVMDGIEPDAVLAQALWPAERDFRSEEVGTPVRDLAVLAGTALVLAMWIYRRTEYDSRDRE